MPKPNLEEQELAMDLLFASLDSTHQHVRDTQRLEPDLEPDTSIPTTEGS